MSATAAGHHESNQGRGSPLFCTPPPEEIQARDVDVSERAEDGLAISQVLGSFFDASTGDQARTSAYIQEPQISSEVNAAEKPRFSEGQEYSAQDLWILDDNWLELGLRYGKKDEAVNQTDRDSTMVPTGSSTTCRTGSTDGGYGRERSHLTSSDTGKSHSPSTVSTSFKHRSLLISTQSSAHNSNTLRQRTGYLSSEEERQFDGLCARASADRKARSDSLKAPSTGKSRGRRPTGKFKSAEFVHSENEGDIEQYGHKQLANIKNRHCDSSSISQTPRRFPKDPKTALVHDNNSVRSGVWLEGDFESLPSSTSMTGKIKGARGKRPAEFQATLRNGCKRPRMLGGFVDESGESEGDQRESEAVDNNHGDATGEEADDEDVISATAPPPIRQLSLHQLPIGRRPAPMPGKKTAVNIARMRMLLNTKHKTLTVDLRSVKGPDSRAKQVSEPPRMGQDVSRKADAGSIKGMPSERHQRMSSKAMGEAKLQSVGKSSNSLPQLKSRHTFSAAEYVEPPEPALRAPRDLTTKQVAAIRPEARSMATSIPQTTVTKTKTRPSWSDQETSVSSFTSSAPPAAKLVSVDDTTADPRPPTSTGLVGGLLQDIRQSEEGRNAKAGIGLATADSTVNLSRKHTRSPTKSQANLESHPAHSSHQYRFDTGADAARSKIGEVEKPKGFGTTPTTNKRHSGTMNSVLRSSSSAITSRDQHASTIAPKSISAKEEPCPGVPAARPDNFRPLVRVPKEATNAVAIGASGPPPSSKGRLETDRNLSSDAPSAPASGTASATARNKSPSSTIAALYPDHARNPAIEPTLEQVKVTTSESSSHLPSHQRHAQAKVGVRSTTAIERATAAKTIPNDPLRGRRDSISNHAPVQQASSNASPRQAMSVEIATKDAQPAPTKTAPAKSTLSIRKDHAEVSPSKKDHVSSLEKLPTEVEDSRGDMERSKKENLGGNHKADICIKKSAQAEVDSTHKLTPNTTTAGVQAVPSTGGASNSAPISAARTTGLVELAPPSAANTVLREDQAQEELKKHKGQRQPAEFTEEADLNSPTNERERPAKVQQTPDSIIQVDDQLPDGSPLFKAVKPNNGNSSAAICAAKQSTPPDTTSYPSRLEKTSAAQHANPIEKQDLPVFLLTTSPNPAAGAEPFFQYTVFQKIWSESASEPSTLSAECSRSFTCVEEANTQAETHSSNLRKQYQQHFQVHFAGWKNEKDEHGCNALTSTFTPIDNPSKKSFMKVWVKRDHVSAYAGVKPADLPHTPFIAKTVYILRLFKLLKIDTDTEPDIDDAADAPETNTTSSRRMHHPLSRTECYTTLDAANRAARDVQIEMSLKTQPNELEKIWQEKQSKELHDKVKELGDEKCWKSEFNGAGLGSDKFELVVEKAGLCGPRNL